MICKFYDKKYQIIRNEAVGIRHIFAIIVYTDKSKFCCSFRATYRKINEEIDDEQVTNRHRELYFYSRCLFESVQFYGQEMSSKSIVYHGLSIVLEFEKFTSYFNAPLSTTTSFRTAQQFSEGCGLVLSLKSAAKYINDPTKTPKYLSVSFLSSFPHEDEQLFYGSHVILQIVNITEAQHLTSHSKELKMFNKFQKTIMNKSVVWNDEKDHDIIDALKILIENQQNKIIFDEHKQEEPSPYYTKYGNILFTHFCCHTNTTQVCIRNW
eukprot:164168_1